MESPAARLLHLLSLLQSRPRWTAAELAPRLHTTERTVRRDVTRLRDLGYPVDADPGRAGGYRLGVGAALPPLLLTNDEAVVVAVGLRSAATVGVTGYEEAAVSALAKLEQVLPAVLREHVLALNATTVLVRRGADAPVDADALLTLAQGCRGPERVRFRYRDGSGNESERRVEPYALVNAERRWYLVARDLDRADWRTFRVDRMDHLALTGHRFVASDPPDAASMVLAGIARVAYDWQAEVVLHAPIAEVAREIAPTVGTLEDAGDTTVLRIGANDLGWIARFLASLPMTFEVRSPKELRKEVRVLARRLAAVPL
ncbi:MAG TPA: YafY family protein [Acidimicrobiales bacterium]|nr:YafY family protein [Acidimicrobiales bacterium]